MADLYYYIQNQVCTLANSQVTQDYQLWDGSSTSPFYGCDVVTYNDQVVSLPDQCNYLFGNIKSIDPTKFITSGVSNMQGMFSYSTVTSLDLSSGDVSRVTNMSTMFSSCTKLVSINVSGGDTSKVTDMNYMFSNCYLLPSVELTHFDTSKVVNFFRTFYHCEALTSLNLSTWDTSSATNMNEMFYSCNKLVTIDITNGTVANLIYGSLTFGYCGELTTIITKPNTNWRTEILSLDGMNFYDMFSKSKKLKNGDNTTNITKANSIDGYFTAAQTNKYSVYEKDAGVGKEGSLYIKDSTNWFSLSVYLKENNSGD